MVLLQLCHVKPSICITDRNEACIVVYLRTPLHQHDHINIDCVFNRTKPINYLFSLCVTMITTMTMIIQLFQQTHGKQYYNTLHVNHRLNLFGSTYT